MLLELDALLFRTGKSALLIFKCVDDARDHHNRPWWRLEAAMSEAA